MFYVYIYRDIQGKPFYVGKGSGNRFKPNLKRNWLVKKKIKEDGSPQIELIEALDEDHAKFLETCLIQVIGREDLGKGPLLNRTDGGDGRTTWSEEQKKAHSAKITGQKRSQEVQEKMSKAAKLRIERDGLTKGFTTAGKPSKLKGRKLSEEHKLKISNGLKGHEVTEETRNKMSRSQKTKSSVKC